MAEEPGSLLDQITLVQVRASCEALLHAGRAALRARGIRLRLRTDFAALVEINRQHRDSWPAFIPMFDPAHNALRIDNSFWLEASTRPAAPWSTHAGRLYDWDDTSLEAELTSLRAFFRDPGRIWQGDLIRVLAPSARRSARPHHGRRRGLGAARSPRQGARHAGAAGVARLRADPLEHPGRLGGDGAAHPRPGAGSSGTASTRRR